MDEHSIDPGRMRVYGMDMCECVYVINIRAW